MGKLDSFIEYLSRYFKGSTGTAEYREVFLCRGDPRSSRRKDRGGVWIGGLDIYVSAFIKDSRRLKEWNVYMGVGYWSGHGLLEPSLDKMLYDRLSFDFDNEESPATVIAEAIGFATLLNRKYGVRPLVFETGFKGAHVVVLLSRPVNWEGYQLLWRHLYGLIPPATRRMVDLNMLQWNRVDRVPLTYNVKEDGIRFYRVAYPRKFTWRDFSWKELEPLDPSSVSVVVVEAPRIVKPAVLVSPRSREKAWIRRVVEAGLRNGRKRFMFEVLIPYLAVVRGFPEDEVLEVCHEFIENSCKNHGNCRKIYDSWIRSATRSAKNHGFRGFSLRKLQEKEPELYSIVKEVLSYSKRREAN